MVSCYSFGEPEGQSNDVYPRLNLNQGRLQVIGIMAPTVYVHNFMWIFFPFLLIKGENKQTGKSSTIKIVKKRRTKTIKSDLLYML